KDWRRACLIPYFYFRPEPLMTPIYWNLVFTAQSGLKSSRPAASATLRSAPRAPAVGNAGGGANLNVGGAQREGSHRRRCRRRRPTRSSPPWALPSIGIGVGDRSPGRCHD